MSLTLKAISNPRRDYVPNYPMAYFSKRSGGGPVTVSGYGSLPMQSNRQFQQQHHYHGRPHGMSTPKLPLSVIHQMPDHIGGSHRSQLPQPSPSDIYQHIGKPGTSQSLSGWAPAIEKDELPTI